MKRRNLFIDDSANSQSQSKKSKKDRAYDVDTLQSFSQSISSQQSQDWQVQAGRIVRVWLKNFMNHADYDYRPTERLNFINGANGSGKSAVLTAIVFALGGTARMSNRGTSNHGLIRHGQSQTTVEISLYNGGDCAYKPELYGETITISRTAMASGGGSYKLKDERGKIVKDRKVKDEVVKILSCFNIQINNPIVILNQDAAKTFLYKNDADKMYDFFMRATQLDECIKEYTKAKTEKDVAQVLLEGKQERLQELEEELKRIEKKYHAIQLLQNKRESLDSLRAALAWSMVREARAEHETALKKVESSKKLIEQNKKAFEEMEDKQRRLVQNKANTEKEIDASAAAVEKFEAELTDLRRQAQRLRASERAAEKTVKEVERKKSAALSEVEAIRQMIDSIRSGDVEREYEETLEKSRKEIEELTKKKNEMEAQISSRQTHMNNLKHSLESVRQNEYEIKGKLQELKSNLDRKKLKISKMEQRLDNKLFLFGEKIPKLVDLIKTNASKFRTLPIGPVGYYVDFKRDVTETEASTIENELRGELRTFLVSHHEDCRLLQSLCDRANISVPIVTMEFTTTAYNVSRNKCQTPTYKTIFDRLEMSNCNVVNYLVDAKHIERILIIPDDDNALSVLSDESTVPKNCLYALTFNFGQFFPAPHLRTYSVRPPNAFRPVLLCSMDDVIDQLKKECAELDKEQKHTQSMLEEARQKHRDHDRELVSAEDFCRNTKPKISEVAVRINQLRLEETTKKPPDVTALEEDCERLEEKVSDMENELVPLTKKHAAAKEESLQMQKTIDEKEVQFNELATSSNPLSERLEVLTRRINKLDQNKRSCQEQIDKNETAIQAANRKVVEASTKLDDQISKATKLCETEIHSNRTPKEIFHDIQVTSESLERQSKDLEEKDIVRDKYEQYTLIYTKVKHDVGRLRDALDHLNRMLKLRREGFKKIRDSIFRRLQNNFMLRLSTRNFRGRIDIDHKQKRAVISVFPDGDPAAGKRDMKGLSGGEKSYSTVALILSLWDEILTPFRCLDEFDVFMDNVNRRTAIDQILLNARKIRNFQYIFLTPLSVDGVEVNEDIQIVKIEKNYD